MLLDRALAWMVAGALAAALPPPTARAFGNVEVGDALANPTLRALDGGRAPLLSRSVKANVFVFFRPHQEHSLVALRQIVGCRAELAGRPVRWVGVVSGSWTDDEIRALVRDAGIDFPVLVDDGDALYGALGVRLHPVVGITDRDLRLAAYQPFREIDFAQLVKGRVQLVLGEITQAQLDAVISPPKANNGTVEEVAHRYVNLARRLWARKNAAGALEFLRRSLEVAPSGSAYGLQGEILAAGGRCAEAAQPIEMALRLDPADASALAGRQRCPTSPAPTPAAR